MNILATGGAGYIGSHLTLALLRQGHRIVVVDNLFRGHLGAIDAIRRAVPAANDGLVFIQADLADTPTLAAALSHHTIETVIHLAAWAYVNESVHDPLNYYTANTAGTASLLQAIDAASSVTRLVFSSSCAVYGEPPANRIPIDESLNPAPITPYGRSKLMAEQMITDYAATRLATARPFAHAFLRYFNAAGCDRSGLLGEHHDPETHLIPTILQCLLARRPDINNTLHIRGGDYATPDGTCIRDYIHVEDLVDAHIAVMHALNPSAPHGDARLYNLAVGQGLSVRQVIASTQRVTGLKLQTTLSPRREGDPPVLFADASKIAREIGWQAKITNIDEIIESAWRWFKAHPKGYAG